MDKGIIVALATSLATFLTVLITNLFNFWNKQIEYKQKIDEHKLSLRSVYTAKKINAGEELIKMIQIRLLASSAVNQFYATFSSNSVIHLDMAQRAKQLINSVIASTDNGSFFSAYYDMESFSKIESTLFHSLNQSVSVLNQADISAAIMISPELLREAATASSITEQLATLYNENIRSIRLELAKYDIL
jgi:hypothetical protein